MAKRNPTTKASDPKRNAGSSGNSADKGSVSNFFNPKIVLALFALILLTRLVYQPAMDNQFVEWDDQLYVTENPMVLNPGKAGTPPVWKTPIALNYHPLTMESLIASSKRAQIKPGQVAPAPFIQANVWWHSLNTALVFLLVWGVTRGNWFVSVFAGLIFALHPMHVESVAWISERKDVMYTFFFLAAAIAYLRYIDQQKTIWLAAAFGLFVLSCLSKAMAVSLVPVLFLIDWYRDRPLGKVWLEKIPFFAAALFFGLVALDIQAGGNFHGMLSGIEGVKTATTSTDKIFLSERIQCASYGMVQYLLRFVAPVDLSPFYPYPHESITHTALPFPYPAAVVALLAITGLAFWSKKYTKAVLFGFGFYLFTVLLVSQIISVGVVVMADRYTYLPYIGLALTVLLLLDQLMTTRPSLRYAIWGAMALFCGYLAFGTVKQIDVWQNSETLWTTAEKLYPEEGQILANLGNYYGKKGDLDKAQQCFEKAIQNGKVRNASIYEGLGNVYGSRNDHRKAAEMFSEAISIDQRKGNYYYNRGLAYSNFDPQKGIDDLTKAIELMPPVRKNELQARRGFCYFQLKNFPKAIEEYTAVINNGGATEFLHYDRGAARLNAGDQAGAMQDFEAALKINPNFELAKKALGK